MPSDKDPATYLSFDTALPGKPAEWTPEPKVHRFRVINHGVPISPDKKTASEALATARQFNMKVSEHAWDGDKGEWVSLASAVKA